MEPSEGEPESCGLSRSREGLRLKRESCKEQDRKYKFKTKF